MIRDSYKDWQESPVSTTITTHPIKELQFPDVTICPPRETNTLVNHLLGKVKGAKFSEKERQDLRDIAREVFVEIPNEKYVTPLIELLSDEYIRSITNGQARMPEKSDDGGITLRSSELEGSFKTPGFSNSDYQGDFYSKPQSLHFILDLPDDLGHMVGEDGALVISVESSGTWSYKLQEGKFQMYNSSLNHSAAEDFCVQRGGHLALVQSWDVQQKLSTIAGGESVWLGGRRIGGEWSWLSGGFFGHQQWVDNLNGGGCLLLQAEDGKWLDEDCHADHAFVCASSKDNLRTGSHSFVLDKTLLGHPWFNFSWTPEKQVGEPQGFQVTWRIENGSLPRMSQLVTRKMSGELTVTPSSSDHNMEKEKFIAIIELPYNISDDIGDGVLQVDINLSSSDAEVEVLTMELHYEYIDVNMSWTEAEAHCVSKGGHLASASNPGDWETLQDLIERKEAKQRVWLGGSLRGKHHAHQEEWFWHWTDESRKLSI